MDRLRFGKVLKPQGLKGELKIGCDSPSEYLNLTTLFIMGRQYEIRSLRASGQYLYVSLTGIDKIEDAELFRGQNVFALKDEIDLNDGQYFIDDLIGCKVVDEVGTTYGVVKRIDNYGSKDVYTLEDSNGVERLFACVEGLLIKVNTIEKVIVVDAGLLRSVLV